MFLLKHLMSRLLFWGLLIQCYVLGHPFTVNYVGIDGVDLFYREAGKPGNPLVLLLHGSPDSSFYFRHLLPILADAGYHVLAPDYPGFGFTQVPVHQNYSYTFASVATTLNHWLASRNVTDLSIYLFDFGAPIGFNIALSGNYNISAIIDQNGGAYADGFGPNIQPLINYGEDPDNQTNQQIILEILAPASIKELYSIGVPHSTIVEPESYTLDSALLTNSEHLAAELSFWRDWPRSVVPAYLSWQEWLRQNQPPLLAIWGKGDPAQLPTGAYAFQRDVPDAEVVLVDAGHFALETKVTQIASKIIAFLKSRKI